MPTEEATPTMTFKLAAQTEEVIIDIAQSDSETVVRLTDRKSMTTRLLTYPQPCTHSWLHPGTEKQPTHCVWCGLRWDVYQAAERLSKGPKVPMNDL